MTLMELPTVSVAARAILSDYGQHGIIIEAGNIVEAPSTHRHDFAILKAVVQVLPEAEARQSVINAARCLRPGGGIVIAGAGVLDDDRLGPLEAVFMNVTFLNLYPHGEAYTDGQYRRWMHEAGFRGVSRVNLDSGITLYRGQLPCPP